MKRKLVSAGVETLNAPAHCDLLKGRDEYLTRSSGGKIKYPDSTRRTPGYHIATQPQEGESRGQKSYHACPPCPFAQLFIDVQMGRNFILLCC